MFGTQDRGGGKSILSKPREVREQGLQRGNTEEKRLQIEGIKHCVVRLGEERIVKGFGSMRKEMRRETKDEEIKLDFWVIRGKKKKGRKMFVTVMAEGGKREKQPDSIFSSDKSARDCTLLQRQKGES